MYRASSAGVERGARASDGGRWRKMSRARRTAATAAACALWMTSSVERARATPVRTMEEFSERVLMADANAIVKFYVDSCGHCRALRRAWTRLGETFGERVVVAEVDCDDAREVCARYDVRSYPTIRFFDEVNGEDGEEYGGNRGVDFDSLAAFVEHRLER